MKLQRIKIKDSSSPILEEIDKVRFEHPIFSCKDAIVKHIENKGGPLGASNANASSGSNLRGNTIEEIGKDIPNIFAYNVVSKIPEDQINNVLKDTHENEYIDLVSPDFHSMDSKRGIMTSYLSNKIANWLSTKDKLKLGFSEYIQTRPPENSILGKIHNFILESLKI